MTVTISFSKSILDNICKLEKNCCSIYSPLNELFCSLHVLLNPQGHGLMASWAIDTKKKMESNLLQELQYFSPLYSNRIPNFIMEEIILEASDIELQLSKLGSSFFDKKTEFLITELKNEFSSTKLVTDLIDNDNLVFLKLFAFLKEYNENYFRDYTEKTKLLATLHDESIKQNNIIQASGYEHFITSIDSNQIYWIDNEIKIQTKMEKTFSLNEGERIYFIPSSVTWPHVRVNRLSEGITITYNINSRDIGNFSRRVMARMFKVLSDPVRIDILVYLNESQKTTKNLSQILNISESTISHHLGLMKELGLVKKRREGKHVFYGTTNKVINLIPNFYYNAKK
ncbi:ArsR/SmtB family transcription factor [Streptococcus mutans]|uniref:ArsR/SmtB family transcription factor n=1 Tax=Streptococcus mutans TaxID=1309 RepID=UPI0009B257BF|nr:winged helix-turn-helix domain-containing protein [Streptococcus mutans]MCY7115579.1 winged helix-turn-helix domain-containing protein [Streptococcus mutans]QIQ94521.1 winged helix-turn-helix transcriptional regulator [Streptococcus mutans]QIR00759.1 winged helix-turn-helix transcriptional regulator [Streptococcus mutans]QIR02410.1 winged helix-turn-helix transcriptional regulator [Streptococcus mutans]QIR04540.1 winged helix-turn-helix transcriptional regulator [Streptococcus mutans]